jgi:hypothetical protein
MYRVMANVLAWTNKIVLVLVLVLETGPDD